MIVAVLQARFTSSRFPGKVLKPILGKPMLWHQIERVKRAQKIDRLILATSTNSSDDPIAALTEESGIACFRGSLENVLDRFYQAAKTYQPEHVVRITGDCPLCDPFLIDEIVAAHEQSGADYTSNSVEPTYPDGLDVEVMKFEALTVVWQEARLPSQKEHVTSYLYTEGNFKVNHYKSSQDFSFLRWTVDDQEDFQLISKIYENLHPHNPYFTMKDILSFLDKNPTLLELNKNKKRNEGYQISLKKDFQPPLKVVIRADASVNIGTGHIVRCLTLAEKLRDESNAAVTFMTSHLDSKLRDRIEAKNFTVHELLGPATDIEEARSFFEKNHTDLLVVDHYNLGAHWEKSMRPFTKKIMVIDDMADRSHDCDILLDQNYYSNKDFRYLNLVPQSCKVYTGPRYSLLRDEFIKARKKLKPREKQIKNILVFFGGADATNETSKAIEAFHLMNEQGLKMTVVIGDINPNKNQILKHASSNIRILTKVDDMAELMMESDLAFGGGGTTSWERCFLGLPTLLVVVAKNQEQVAQDLDRAGAVWNLGWHQNVTAQSMVAALKLLLETPQKLVEMSLKALALMGEPQRINL